MSFAKPADPWFDGLTAFAIVLFLFEWSVSCVGKVNYTWSFFFYLDGISTLSLILDLTFVSEQAFATQGSASEAGSGSEVARAGTGCGYYTL